MPAGVVRRIESRSLLSPYELMLRNLIREGGLDTAKINQTETSLKALYESASPLALFSDPVNLQVLESHIQSELLTIDSPLLAGLLQGGSAKYRLILFCLTLGPVTENLSISMEPGRALEEYILYRSAAHLVSLTADRLGAHISGDPAADGLLVSRPFMAGSCGWSIDAGLKDIFMVLKPESSAMSLNPSGMISPLNSLGGIFILSPAGLPGSPCPLCQVRECSYRNP